MNKDIHYQIKQNTGTKFLHNFRVYTRLSLYVLEISFSIMKVYNVNFVKIQGFFYTHILGIYQWMT